MRILQINQNYNFGSTGRIMKDISDIITKYGNESYMLCAYSPESSESSENLYITEKMQMKKAILKNILITRLTGLTGYRKKKTTSKAIEWVDSIKPDIIHLHNIHGDWINIELLFDYINRNQIPVVWTLHDCWCFTGRCSHFIQNDCFQWRDGCKSCPKMDVYPISYFFDWSKKMWEDKRHLFTALDKAIIATPSKWIGGYVKESYLKKYRVVTIHNGIDVNRFIPKKTISKYIGSTDKKIVLGVAATWNALKGLKDMIEVSKILNAEKYQVVLVGLNERQLKQIPSSIIGIKRTNSVEELAEIYSQASVFVNTTYQDNYPTVNLESIACGTPVITYRTGGSPESVPNNVGIVVEQGNLDELISSIELVCNNVAILGDNCRAYAEQNFDKHIINKQYLDLYSDLLNKDINC